jgi:hypothetical protein
VYITKQAKIKTYNRLLGFNKDNINKMVSIKPKNNAIGIKI